MNQSKSIRQKLATDQSNESTDKKILEDQFLSSVSIYFPILPSETLKEYINVWCAVVITLDYSIAKYHTDQCATVMYIDLPKNFTTPIGVRLTMQRDQFPMLLYFSTPFILCKNI
jgi:hypothetical protein